MEMEGGESGEGDGGMVGSDMRNLVSVGKICFLCIWPTEKMINIAIQTEP